MSTIEAEAINPPTASGPDYSSVGATIIQDQTETEGYCFPAEWCHHEKTLMQYPPQDNWGAKSIKDARAEWVAVANAIAEFEPVTMGVDPADMKLARSSMGSEIELVEMPLDDGWCRDSGPMILVNGLNERRIPGFEFNGWGKKFSHYHDDALVKGYFSRHLNFAIHPVDLVLEGGAVAVDGEGTLITTDQCLFHKNRNIGKSKEQIEDILQQSLGVKKIIWIPKGLEPDPITDGHIDGMVAYVKPGVVLLHTTNDQSDPNYQITKTAKNILENTMDAKGRKLEVIEIPMTSEDVLHINFYVCNGAVIVPVAGNKKEDKLPLDIIAEAYPSRRVVPITGVEIAGGGGGIHCITQQVPSIS
jgi:agmatine deiminase